MTALADRASARRARLQAGEAHGVRCVIRRQEHGKPKVDASAPGPITQAFFPGTARETLLADDTLVLAGRALDAEVQRGTGRHALPRRRVGLQTPTRDGCFRTN